jgi:hypothetical protein
MLEDKILTNVILKIHSHLYLLTKLLQGFCAKKPKILLSLENK